MTEEENKANGEILIIGSGNVGRTCLSSNEIQEIVDITKLRSPEPFIISDFKIPLISFPEKSGKEKRRERRKNK